MHPTLSYPITSTVLTEVNAHLSNLEPIDVLAWGVENLPNLYQSTAFGLTGLAGTDMLSKIPSTSTSSLPHSKPQPDLIFIDTRYHFKETLDLKDAVHERYGVAVHVYGSEGAENASEIEAKYGERLWETDEALYDYVVKVEPAQRAYRELGVKSIITGRRASQGGARTSLAPLEIDSTGLLKLNPFYSWSFGQVKAYLDQNNVPRNALLSQGYKSVGDWHSTVKSGEGEGGEREGRWKGKEKTECGLHKDYFLLKRMALKNQREAELRQKDEAMDLDNKLSVIDLPMFQSIGVAS